MGDNSAKKTIFQKFEKTVFRYLHDMRNVMPKLESCRLNIVTTIAKTHKWKSSHTGLSYLSLMFPGLRNLVFKILIFSKIELNSSNF